MSKLLKVQIIACGPGLDEITKVHGVSSEWIRNMISSKVCVSKIVRAYLGEPPTINENTAWIIMGSRYSAYEDLDWINSLKNSICQAVDKKIPILGICFGHQILCSALGAKVFDNSAGWEIGSSRVQLTDKGKLSPLFNGFDKQFSVYQSHHDVVSHLPDNIDLLCANEYGVQSISFSDFIYGVQFHPEFSYDVMNAYFRARTKDLKDGDFKVVDRNDGIKVVDNFINLILKEG